MIFAENALKYFNKGYSPLPIKPGTKVPYITEWQQYCIEQPTLSVINQWIKTSGNYGVGLALGEGMGIDVLDIDLYNEELYQRILKIIPPSPVGKRGAKGGSFFYQYSDTFTKKNAIGYEFLSTGSQTVIPPSIHKDTNKPYFWVTDKTLLDIDKEDLPLVTNWDDIFDLMDVMILEDMKINPHFYEEKKKKTKGLAKRNNKLKEIVCARAFDGKDQNDIVDFIYNYDLKNHSKPLFSDFSDFPNRMRSPKENAEKFACSILRSINSKIASKTLIPKKPTQVKKEKQVELLGTKGASFYYFVRETGEVINLTASQHNKDVLPALAPKKFWVEEFPITSETDKDDIIDGKINKSLIFIKQRKLGVFDEDRIRGAGLWLDKGIRVINFGEKIWSEKEFETNNIYRPQKNNQLILNKELTSEHVSLIKQFFDLLTIESEISRCYFINSIFYLNIFGWLKWRPNIWITGNKGCGKTFIIKEMLNTFLKYWDIQLIEESTAAGIRQDLNNDSKTVFYDEAEPNAGKAINRMEEILALARSCNSNSGSRSLRGSKDNRGAISVSLNAVFVFSSIQTFFPSDADQSRFIVIEMGKAKNTWDKFQSVLDLMPNDISERIFSFSVNNFERYMQIQDQIRKKLQNLNYESRAIDTICPSIGYYCMLFEPNIDEFISKHYKPVESDDSENPCFKTIMDLKTNDMGQTIAQLVSNASNVFGTGGSCLSLNTLNSFGIDLIDKWTLFIQNNNLELRKLLKHTNYSANYGSLLKRSNNFVESRTHRINKVSKYGHVLKLE